MPTRQHLFDIIDIQTQVAKLGLDLGGVMSLVADRTLALVDADGAAVELAEGTEMVYRAASGTAAGQIGLGLSIDHSLSGLCVRTGQIMLCDDSEDDPRVDRDACRRVGLRSMLIMPLKHNGTVVGALKAVSSQPGKFKKRDQDVLNLLSDVVGAAMFFAAKYDIDTLFHRATHDEMTGLANRALFMERLHSALSRGQRDHLATGVIMIDMNGLKGINDNLGHRAGDAALTELASRIGQATRSSDTAARLGGDEFAVVLSPVGTPEEVDVAITRLKDRICAPFLFEGRDLRLRASIGAAHSPNDGREIKDLIEIADQRMYSQKRQHYGDRPGR